MPKQEQQGQPRGEPILRTLAMPADTNPIGDIFGGWILSQMDIAGGILAREIAESLVDTVAVDSMKLVVSVPSTLSQTAADKYDRKL